MLPLARYFAKTSLLFLSLGLSMGAHRSATLFLRYEPPDHYLFAYDIWTRIRSVTAAMPPREANAR